MGRWRSQQTKRDNNGTVSNGESLPSRPFSLQGLLDSRVELFIMPRDYHWPRLTCRSMVSARQLPALSLLGVGIILVAFGVVASPTGGSGGLGVAWVGFTLLLFFGGGGGATVAGGYALVNRQFVAPLALLSVYVAVGLVYTAIRLRLFPGFSAVGFTALAVAVVTLVPFATTKLVAPWLDSEISE